MPTVGVLALQGAFDAHRDLLHRLGANTAPIRTAKELVTVDALVLPGGESSAMLRLMEPEDLLIRVGERISAGLPVLATCAGVILLARGVTPNQESLGLLDIDVERNAYGRQVYSSVEPITPCSELREVFTGEGVFIRAPRITRLGSGVEALAWRGEDPVLVRTQKILAATFHPELGGGTAVHQLFLQELNAQG